jgi:hypothetical protein
MKRPSLDLGRWREPILFTLLLSMALAANVWWHKSHAVRLNTDIQDHGQQIRDIAANPAAAFVDLISFSPRPFISHNLLVTGLIARVSGFSGFSLVMSGTFFYLLTICFVYLATRRKTGPGGAFVAGMAVALLPALFGWSRVFNPSASVALMVLPAAGICLAAWSDRFSRPLPAVSFLLVAALSMRAGGAVSDNFQSLPLFVALAGYEFIAGVTSGDGKNLRRYMWLALAGLLAVLIWRTPFFQQSARYLLDEAVTLGQSRFANSRFWHDPLSLSAYPVYLWLFALMPFFSLATLVASGRLLHRVGWRDQTMLVSFWAPLLVASLVSKKNFSYVFVALPAAGAIIGQATGTIKRRRFFWAVAVLIGLVGTIQYWHYSFSTQPEFASLPNWTYKYWDEPPRPHPTSAAREVDPREQMAQRISSMAEIRGELNVLLFADPFSGEPSAIRFFVLFFGLGDNVSFFSPDGSVAQHTTAPPDLVPDVIVTFLPPESVLEASFYEPFTHFGAGNDSPERDAAWTAGWAQYADSIAWDTYDMTVETMTVDSQPVTMWAFFRPSEP